MPLPNEWDNVNWRPGVVILPDTTEGIRMAPLNRDKYPQFPRGYFMMATTDQAGKIIYYNAADVGEAGPLVSQFVFWHEMGHFHLGHTHGVPSTQLAGVSPAFGGSYTSNKEVNADRFAYNYWIKRRSMHGIQVIESVIDYFARLGNADGDNEHPSPKIRQNLLSMYLDNSCWEIVIHNDNTTNPDFVRHVLVDNFKMTGDAANSFIEKVEREGRASIKSIRKKTAGPFELETYDITKTKAELLVIDITRRAKIAGNFEFRLEARPL